MRYSDEFRHRVVAEVLPPKSRPVVEVSEEHGISSWSLYRWKKAVKNGTLDHGAMKPSERPLAEKLSLLLEGTRVAEDQRGEWLRGRGLHSEHLSLYEQEIRDVMTEKEKRQREEIELLRKHTKRLERELSRKDKALAEMAALMALKKKLDLLYGKEDEES